MGQPAFHTEHHAIPEMPEAKAVVLRGRVTLDEAPALRKEILADMADKQASKIVLQLSGVEEMDTAGAAVLAEALKFGQQRGARVLLCSPSEPVMNIFRLAGFGDVLQQCCSDPEETHRRLVE